MTNHSSPPGAGTTPDLDAKTNEILREQDRERRELVYQLTGQGAAREGGDVIARRAVEVFYRSEGEGVAGDKLYRCALCGKGWSVGGSFSTGPIHHSPCLVEKLEAELAAVALDARAKVAELQLAEAKDTITIMNKLIGQLTQDQADARQALAAIVQEWREREAKERGDNWCNTEDMPIWRAIHAHRADIFQKCADQIDAWIAAQPPVRQETVMQFVYLLFMQDDLIGVFSSRVNATTYLDSHPHLGYMRIQAEALDAQLQSDSFPPYRPPVKEQA